TNCEKEVIHKKIKKRKKGKKQQTVIIDSIEKRKAVLNASFLKAGITQQDIDNILSDKRIEIYYNIYEQKDSQQKKKRISYFDDEFGLFKPESIESGKKLITSNKETFEKIENLYGVPANYITAIIRIETDFNKHLGKYGVFNSLYTMSMLSGRGKRVAMANKELVIWVKMCRQKGIDPLDMKGSWAGAFGIPQFMPSSYTIFAVDYNGDGKIDLYDYPDSLPSIANFLRHMGWQTGNEKKMRRAVYRYNHEKAYVDAVFAYAGKI
ncbi:MAG: lytic murein transglycosylase, partial [Smithella sp.]